MAKEINAGYEIGHYFAEKNSAVKDFKKRIREERAYER